jgi:hypothetical protein
VSGPPSHHLEGLQGSIFRATIWERDAARALELSPVLAIGAFAVPGLQPALLGRGLEFSDWAAARWFRSTHLAPTFPD